MTMWIAGLVLALLIFGPLAACIWWLDTHRDWWY